jgi:hypothetical protein
MKPNKILIVVAFAAVSVSFQNCGNSVGYSANTSTAIQASASPSDVLGEINFADITEIDVDARVGSGTLSGESKAITLLNGTARTLDSQLAFVGGGVTLASCHVIGQNADFSALEAALKSMTIVATQHTSSLPNIAALQLSFKLKDGSVKAFLIDTNNGASVTGLQAVHAPALRSELMAMTASGSCSTALGSLPSIPGFTLPTF